VVLVVTVEEPATGVVGVELERPGLTGADGERVHHDAVADEKRPWRYIEWHISLPLSRTPGGFDTGGPPRAAMTDTDGPFDVRLRVGEVLDAGPFPEAEKPELAKLTVDVGEETLRSAAQTGYNYDAEELVGRQVLCATNLGAVRIAGFESEALTVGVPDADGHPVLVAPDVDVPLGGTLY
jgi:tRNA-binding protein